jgi:broad specificity phosphatase PhoE
MVLKITYFVHGTTTDNSRHVASGQADVELNELGIQHALMNKKGLLGKKFDVVFCSDLKRAVDTAELVFEDTLEIIQDKRLREVDYGDLTQTPKNWNILDYITKQYPNGESYKDVANRLRAFLQDADKKYDHIAIVAHQAPQLAIEVITKDQTWQHAIANDWRKQKAWKPGWDYIYRE